MAAGERPEEPLAELSHYVVARPIYSEAGFQEENERRPPLPPTLRERAQAACRCVAAPGAVRGAGAVRRAEAAGAGGRAARAPINSTRRGMKWPAQRRSVGRSVFASLHIEASGRSRPQGASSSRRHFCHRHLPHPRLEDATVPTSARPNVHWPSFCQLRLGEGFPVAAPRGTFTTFFLADVQEKGPFRSPNPSCPSWSGCPTTG